MSDEVRTRSFPFGRDVDTLVLCMDERLRDIAVKALGIPAQYESIWCALAGHRYKKIIVLCGGLESATEEIALRHLLTEVLPTKLDIGGELFII